MYWGLFLSFFVATQFHFEETVSGLNQPLFQFEFIYFFMCLIGGGHDGMPVPFVLVSIFLLLIGQISYLKAYFLKSEKLKIYVLLIGPILQIAGMMTIALNTPMELNQRLYTYLSFLPFLIMTAVLYFHLYKLHGASIEKQEIDKLD